MCAWLRQRGCFGGFDGLGHEHGDRHRANAAGNRRVGTATGDGRFDVDVADTTRVIAGMDDDGAVLDPGTLDEMRAYRPPRRQCR